MALYRKIPKGLTRMQELWYKLSSTYTVTILHELRKLAFEAKTAITEGEFDSFGEILHRGWELKQQMASNITNETINPTY